MALIKCTECGKEISASAAACPNCGAKPPAKTSKLTWIVGGVFAFVVVSCISTQNSSNAPSAPAAASQTPEQIATAKARADAEEKEFQFAVMAAKLVRSSLKNPASFELVAANLVVGGALCIKYRATNGFGAVVTEEAAITRKLSKGEWNKDCAGKSAADMKKIRFAL